MEIKRVFLMILALFFIIPFVMGETEPSSSSGGGGGGGGSGCFDTDGGENFQVKGTTTGIYAGASEGYHVIIGGEPDPKITKTSPYNYSIAYDYCFSSSQVYESYCGSDDGKIHTKIEVCEDHLDNSICLSGACVPNPLATDKKCSEFGYNTQHGVINYCDESRNSYGLSVCYNVTYNCSDSDGGKDYYTLGQLSIRSSSKQGPSCYAGMGSSGGGGSGSPTKDICINSDTLKERICNADGTAGASEYKCPNGCTNGVCIKQEKNETEQEEPQPETKNETESVIVTKNTYFKTCTYVLDVSPFVGQEIKLTAGIKDENGSENSDAVVFKVLDTLTGSSRGGRSFDKNKLDIQIISPRGDVGGGAVDVKISSQGPNKLKDMTLTIQAGQGAGMLVISNKNCVSGSSSGGGSGAVVKVPSSCERYYKCSDGSEVQYCFIHKTYNENGEIVGAGCGCKAKPESLCPSSSEGDSGGGHGVITPIPGSGSGGGPGRASNETPLICDGCVLGNKCVFVGYRTEGKYCGINSEFKEQKNEDKKCDNNFECSSNLCISDSCVSEGLLKKILKFFRRIFGLG